MKRCEYCAAWFKERSECRRHAPTVASIIETEESDYSVNGATEKWIDTRVSSQWPRTEPDDWCLDFSVRSIQS